MANWLVTTEHLEDRLLFRDVQDFVVGMNYVAVQAFRFEGFVLSFVLMSNHLHFVLRCNREQAEACINGFKTSFSRYLWKKYGSREHLRRLKVDYKLIEGEEALEWAVAYVQMNPVAANVCVSPFDYPWGTGNCFFRFSTERGTAGAVGSARATSAVGAVDATGAAGVVGAVNAVAKGGKGKSQGVPRGAMPDRQQLTVGAMSARQRLRILHTRAPLPEEWLVDPAGYVLPESYVRKEWVEAAYHTPRRMQFFLQNSSKAKLRMEMDDANLPAFRDQVILAAVPDLCQSLFRRQSVKELAEEQKVELLRQLRFRFSAGPNQLARVTGLTYENAARYLDRV